MKSCAIHFCTKKFSSKMLMKLTPTGAKTAHRTLMKLTPGLARAFDNGGKLGVKVLTDPSDGFQTSSPAS